jgi:hypothetical protein
MSATIYNNIDKVAGDPQISVTVTLELLWDKNLAPVAKVDDTDTMIAGSYTFNGDENGYWEKEVVVNGDISPTDTIYKVTEAFNDGTNNTYYISVETSATPIQWVGDIITATPDWI